MNFEKLENIMIESLIDPSKKVTLPHDWVNKEFNLQITSHTRALIRHFAYHLQLEMLKDVYKEKEGQHA